MSEFCDFCKIASGKAQASIVYEDQNLMAFMDLHPANVGHVLVIPREHWETIYEIPGDVLAELFVLVKRIAVAVKKTVGAEGMNIVQCNERVAFQSVEHFHVHVIPRFEGDAITKTIAAILAPIEFEKATKQDLDEVARKIKQNL